MAAPLVSVIIASLNGPQYLDACLRSLTEQSIDSLFEVIVADVVGDSIRTLISEQYPHVTLLSFSEQRTIGQLRFAAMQSAGGEIIALTEDHCVLPPDWLQTIIDAHQRHTAVAIGGSIENGAVSGIADWTAFLCEYAGFSANQPEGAVKGLAGPNVSYKRAVLAVMHNSGSDEFWEGQFHDALTQHGSTLYFMPSLRVIHQKHFQFTEYWIERFAYGRWFAGTRRTHLTPIRWLLYLSAFPLIGLLILFRLLQSIAKAKIGMSILLPCIPAIVATVGVGLCGEIIGHLFGKGQSAYRLK